MAESELQTLPDSNRGAESVSFKPHVLPLGLSQVLGSPARIQMSSSYCILLTRQRGGKQKATSLFLSNAIQAQGPDALFSWALAYKILGRSLTLSTQNSPISV